MSALSATKGFTLVELLVVMALMSAMAAVVAPQMWNQYVGFTERSQVERFWSQIRSSIRQARLNNRHYTLEPATAPVQSMAKSNELSIISRGTILFRADGVSSGGEVILQTKRGRRWVLTVAPLDGGAQIAPQGQ